MTFTAESLMELLPAILRLRDRERAVPTPAMLTPRDRSMLAQMLQRSSLGKEQNEALTQLRAASMAGPLGNLLALFAEQIGILEEDLEQLYDDQFIETCADWVAPYIGASVGYRVLSGSEPGIASPRAEVARTITYRRRKGTAQVLERVAADVTGWNAKATEFFAHVIVGQHINHPRPGSHAAPDLRDWRALEYSRTSFDPTSRALDVRSIRSGRGRYNFRNVGLFLWRLGACSLSGSSAARVDERRWRFHPLGIDEALYTSPQSRLEGGQVVTPLSVPIPISRRALASQLGDYYGSNTEQKSFRLYVGVPGHLKPVPIEAIRVANLSDAGSNWAHSPAAGRYAVDPLLGRIALPPNLPKETIVEVDFNYGFSGEIGGGEYERTASVAAADGLTRVARVPETYATVAEALASLDGSGTVEISDSRRYQETLAITVRAGATVELRAANRARPMLMIDGPLTIVGGENASVRLDGLLIVGGAIDVPQANNHLRRLDIDHCTLVPGQKLAADTTPLNANAANLTVSIPEVAISIGRSIVGALRTHERCSVTIDSSIVDSTGATLTAFAAIDGSGCGGTLRLDACTVVGKINARDMPMVTNSILLAALAPNDTWTSPVIAERRQEGCVRFSYVPVGAHVPRRFRCLPERALSPELAAPRFTSLRYGTPGYGQLSTASGAALLSGADDEGQPGAFHFLNQPQREANLRVRLEEYLRVGLEAGLFYES